MLLEIVEEGFFSHHPLKFMLSWTYLVMVFKMFIHINHLLCKSDALSKSLTCSVHKKT